MVTHIKEAHPEDRINSSVRDDIERFYDRTTTVFCIQSFSQTLKQIRSHYSCAVCKKEYKSYDQVYSHFEAVCGKDIKFGTKPDEMKVRKTVFCKHCPATFSKELYLSIHMGECHENDTYDTG